jgi:hypothetical protein
MPIQAAVVTLLLAAPPSGPAASAMDPHKVFAYGLALSGAVVFRMDSMSDNVNAEGVKALENARALSAKIGLPFPDDAVFKGARTDTVEAMGFLLKAREHPITRLVQERHGRPTAALFELGLVSQLALTGGVPSPEAAKDLADLIETPARDSGLPRESWIGVVDAYRTRKSESERVELCLAMVQAVGKSLRSRAAAAR